MTVKEIVIEYLKANGFDGLCHVYCPELSGGCPLDDLGRCSGTTLECEAAHKMPCLGDKCPHPCHVHQSDCFAAMSPGRR